MDSILFALWFFLPAGGANAAPIIAARLPFISKWDTPMDFGWKFRGKPIFGKHKTWRGLVGGVVAATLTVYILQVIWQTGNVDFLKDAPVSYLDYSPLLLGVLYGAGALVGDAIESFFKRQRSISPGKRWVPYDQIDYIIGGCLAMALVIRLSLAEYILILLLWFSLHLAFSYLGYTLKLKQRPV